jgi:chemotaxis protein CheD
MIRIRNIKSANSQAVAHYKGHTQRENLVRIYTGDVATSTRPVVMHTLLGSCVAVCLYDPLLRAGGMNHILLPGGCEDCTGTRFGVHAMELLINELMKRGGDRRRFLSKAFGGANVMNGLKTATIGDDNAKFVRKFLDAERIPLVGQRLGGTQAVHVYFTSDSGKAIVQSVDGSQLPRILHAENSYWRTHHSDNIAGGEITLF